MAKDEQQSERLRDRYQRLMCAIDLVDANIMMCDVDMNIVFANHGVVRMFSDALPEIRRAREDFDPEKLVGRNLLQYHRRPNRSARFLRRLDATYETDLRFAGADFRIRVNPVFDGAGERLGCVVEWQNLTAEGLVREHTERQRRQAERVLNGIGDLRLVLSRDGRIVDVSDDAEEMLGFGREALIGTPVERLLPRGMTFRSLRELAVDGFIQSMQTTLERADGGGVLVDFFGLISNTGRSGDTETVLILHVHGAAAGERRRTNSPGGMAEHVGEGVALLDAGWTLISANPAISEILGRTPGELIGRRLDELMPGIGDGRLPGADWRGEYDGVRENDGERFSVVVSTWSTSDGDGANRMLALKDITDLKTSERHIRELAFKDTLTGLANRSYFERRVRETIDKAARRTQYFALLFFDLDGFKEVNDTLGHAAGDRLLKLVGERLRDSVRRTDLVARFGGDEFCVLLFDIHRADIASRIARKCLDAVAENVAIEGREFRPQVSAGITLFPGDGQQYAELLHAADTAMYAAKREGRHGYAFFRPEMSDAVQEKLDLEQSLRAALSDRDFVVHYRPQVDLTRGHVTGFEAVPRWRHPQRGLVGPSEFVPVLDDLRLTEELDVLVLRDACARLAAWRRQGIAGMIVGVNVGTGHFAGGRIVDNVRRAIEESGASPGSLELEFTEVAVQDAANVDETCRALREIGVRLAVDDFGSGPSSLDLIRQLSPNRLKISRAFVADLSDAPDGAPLVATIVAMGRAMGIQLVATNVAELKQIQSLLSLGCETGQGAFFGGAVAPERVPAIINQTFVRPVRQEAQAP